MGVSRSAWGRGGVAGVRHLLARGGLRFATLTPTQRAPLVSFLRPQPVS
jgi:hypothetical protein